MTTFLETTKDKFAANSLTSKVLNPNCGCAKKVAVDQSRSNNSFYLQAIKTFRHVLTG